MWESEPHADCSPVSSLTDGPSLAGCWPYPAGLAGTSVCDPEILVLTSGSDFYLPAADRNSEDSKAHAGDFPSPSGPLQSKIILLL